METNEISATLRILLSGFAIFRATSNEPEKALRSLPMGYGDKTDTCFFYSLFNASNLYLHLSVVP